MTSILLAASTLLVPPSGRPVPAVVIVQGAGAADRDGTVGPNKPLADIAEGLAARGIASIRFDGDGEAAVREVAKATGVDPSRVFVVGHAEGAAEAPGLAQRTGSIRGLVLLAPGVRPVDARLIDQVAYGAKLVGMTSSEIADQSRLLADRFLVVKDPGSATDPMILGRPAAYWRDLLSVDIRRSIRSTKLPVLVLQGEQDFEVRKDLDFDVLRGDVGSAGGRVAYRTFPGLNHHFIPVPGISSGAEYATPGRVDPAVISAIADWVLAH